MGKCKRFAFPPLWEYTKAKKRCGTNGSTSRGTHIGEVRKLRDMSISHVWEYNTINYINNPLYKTHYTLRMCTP